VTKTPTIRTESDLQRAILLRIGALPGVYVARTAASACYQPDGRGGYRLHRPLPAGWPDLTAVVCGRAVAIEVKSPGSASPGRDRAITTGAGLHPPSVGGCGRDVDHGVGA
jgi:hypothetical protein